MMLSHAARSSRCVVMIGEDDNASSCTSSYKSSQQLRKKSKNGGFCENTIVVRPNPQRISGVETFYNTVYKEQVPITIVQEAIVCANEWDRKWSNPRGLEEKYYCYSNENNNDDDSSAILQEKAYVDMLTIEREMGGARNPSPDESNHTTNNNNSHNNNTNMHKRNRGLLSSSPCKNNNHDSSMMASSSMMVVVRPKAMRIGTVLPSPSSSSSASTTIITSMSSFSKTDDGNLDYPTNCYYNNDDEGLLNVVEDDDDQQDYDDGGMITNMNVLSSSWIMEPSLLPTAISTAKDGILLALAISGGETTSNEFQSCLHILKDMYQQEITMSSSSNHMHHMMDMDEGMWLTLTKPTFIGNLGITNDQNDPMYTLGRMSFDMFQPANLVCSLQGNFNSIESLHHNTTTTTVRIHPQQFQEDITNGIMKTYDIVTAFTIEPSSEAFPKNAPNQEIVRPIRGIMTTYGYTVPAADQEDSSNIRKTVWIAGGKIEPNNNEQDQKEWKRFFGSHYTNQANLGPVDALTKQVKVLASKLLSGATKPESMCPITGTMEYTFEKPIGGHGKAYVDTLYCDNTLRIVQGHRGTIYVFTRIQ